MQVYHRGEIGQRGGPCGTHGLLVSIIRGRCSKRPRKFSLTSPQTAKRSMSSSHESPADGDASSSSWPGQDDLILNQAIQGGDSFLKISRCGKFTRKYSVAEIEERWKALFLNKDVAVSSSAKMVKLPCASRRVLWSEFEEQVLAREVRQSEELSTFQRVLENNRASFHPSRTAKSLEAHYYRMKRKGTLDKFLGDGKGGVVVAVEDPSMNPGVGDAPQTALPTPQVEEKRRTALMQKRAYNAKHRRCVGIVRGRNVYVEMRSVQLLIGRNTDECVVDVDLCLEGPSPRVSRRHVLITHQSGDTHRICNVGKYPIWVNSHRVQPNHAVAATNAVLEIGGHSLTFVGSLGKVRKRKTKTAKTS